MDARTLSRGLAINRCGFGLAYLIAPGRAGSGWIGPTARGEPAQVMIRAHGARDLTLGIGALEALRDDGDARAWFAAHALADGVDLAATLAARRSLPARNVVFACAMAGASTAIALLGTLTDAS